MPRSWGANSYAVWQVKVTCWMCGKTSESDVTVPLSISEAVHLIRPAKCSVCDVGWRYELIVYPDGSSFLKEEWEEQ